MENLSKDSLFEFNPDTLEYVRKQYDLDKPGRIEEAINILDEWIQKQPHFKKKDFPKDYLERAIIMSKGSVERAKMKLDRICTFRTIYPEFFGVYDFKNYQTLKDLHGAFLPKLTKDHYRIYLIKNNRFNSERNLLEYYRYFAMQCEYVQAHDYCNGIIILLDYRTSNIVESMKVLNINEMKKSTTVTKEGYGMRIKGIHVLTESKTMDILVSLLKQIFSNKLSDRIVIHKTFDTLYDHFPKEALPKEYGGEEKSLLELHEQFQEVLTSKEFTEYLTEINKACTNEDLRLGDSEETLGIGSFRKLSVD